MTTSNARSASLAAATLLLVLLWASTAGAANLQTLMVPMDDGTKLATDVITPDGEGPWPTILFRTPYNKNTMRDGNRALADQFGVAIVLQDTRGRFASEGTDCVFRCDAADGARTIRLIDEQPWSNGKIVSAGASALGIVQYMHASAGPEALDGMWVQVATPTVYDHGIFWDGVFRQSMMTNWLQAQGSEFFLDEIKQHPTEDGFWETVQTDDDYGEVDVPTVHWGGWYDIFSQGTINAFNGYQNRGGAGARGEQILVMGPWVHGGWNSKQKQGELQYPDNAFDGGPFAEQLYVRWMSHRLGLRDLSDWLDSLPAVHYYVMGAVGEPSAPGNAWRTNDTWPPEAEPVRMYLQPQGGLAAECPPSDGGETTYTYDPTDPSPTKGGNNLSIQAGPVDQRPVEAREDVVVFQTPPLEEPMEITGRVKAHLSVASDAADTDVMVRMTDVYPDGRSMLVLDAPARLNGQSGEVTVDLWSTSIILAEGHRLRVSITSSNAPRFRPNPTPATVDIHHSKSDPSYLVLPDPSAAEADVVECQDPTAEMPDAGSPDTGDTGSPDTGSDTGESSDAEVDWQGPTDTGGDAAPSTGCGCRMMGGTPLPVGAVVFVVGLVAVRLGDGRGR